jgi:glycosyltransferase involved in cell wall biosynthesis
MVHHYATKYKVPYILQAHGSLPRIMQSEHLKLIIDIALGNKILKDASKVIALSKSEAIQYNSLGVPHRKIVIMPNALDLSEFANLPAKDSFKNKMGINVDDQIILYLGRINRIKGIDLIVEAFSKAIDILGHVKLVVVGPDDGYLNELASLVKNLDLQDSVLITGPLYGNDKLEAYVDAHILILPSKYETFPVSVLEALACGTPIILSRNCAVADYFRDRVGLIVKPDSNHIKEALLKMFIDKMCYSMFRKNCAETILEFDISKMAPRLVDIYKNIIEGYNI